MTNFDFWELCRDTCLRLNVEDTESLSRDGEIVLEGVRLGAFFNEESGDGIHCFVDLGPVNAEDRLEHFQRLLELNLELGRMHGESLCYERQSGHVILRSEITDLAHCDAESMAEWLKDYAVFAHEYGNHIQGAQDAPVTNPFASRI